MSSSEGNTPRTFQERSSQATHALCEALELGVVGSSELKYLALALTLVATEEVVANADFATRLRSLYLSLIPQRAETSRRASRVKSWEVKLTPLGNMDESMIDPYGPPNPFGLQQLYGNEQLPLALERYAPARLRGAVAIVQERYPGTKPKSMSKAAIIEYIVKMLTSGS
ncbi:MAG TPA: hypothetical protein VGR57_09540 [Ktedonobacterales bacterium]|nr:hypothetical protein [Ktedonobacterales bacterium]